MSELKNPALDTFTTMIGQELVMAQLIISRQGAGFELRHVEDRQQAVLKLRTIALDTVRTVAQSTSSGAYRPLKSAPNLQSGWRLVVADAAGLERALAELYPGAVADWHTARSPQPSTTNFQQFTSRQTGMYRITAMLTDEQAASAIGACCAEAFCLKRRLWTGTGRAADPPAKKSLIPCLEPCAIMLEFARKTMRIEQQEKVPVNLAPDEIATLVSALETALAHPNPQVREADFASADNPRRLRLTLEKLKTIPLPKPKDAEE